MIKILFLGLFLTTCLGCADIPKGTFNSHRLVSSKGEEIFINTINWGVTDDYQLSVISKDSLKLKERKNTIGSVEGLDPFIYYFENDTLTVLFYDKINYKISDSFNTITVLYQTVSSSEYLALQEKTDVNSNYFSVPIRW